MGCPAGICGAWGSPRKSWGGQCQLTEGLSDRGLQHQQLLLTPPALGGGQRGWGAMGQDLWVQPHTWQQKGAVGQDLWGRGPTW